MSNIKNEWFNVTIVDERYGSGFIAYEGTPDNMPAALNGGEDEHYHLLKDYRMSFGFGDTPNDAYKNLEDKRNQAGYLAAFHFGIGEEDFRVDN